MSFLDSIFGGGQADPSQAGLGALPDEVQGFGSSSLRRAAELFNQGPFGFFPGSTFAGLTPQQLAGLNQQSQFATGVLPGQLNNLFGSFNSAINPDFMESEAVKQGLGSIENRANRNLFQNVLPGIERSATGHGQFFGSTGADKLKLQSAFDTQGQTSDAQAAFLADQFGNQQRLQGQALGMAPQTFGMGLLPGQIQQNVGGVFQNQNAQQIAEDMARFNFDQNAPGQNIDEFIRRFSNVGNTGGGASFSPGQDTGISPFSALLGGAALYGGFNSAFPNFFGGGGGGGGGYYGGPSSLPLSFR